MTAVPKVIGSFQDLKFRQAIAKLLATARHTLFDAVNLNNGVGNPGVLLRHEFASSLFRAPGDTIFVTFHGKGLASTSTKGITISVFDTGLGTITNILGEYNAISADITNTEKNFYGMGSLVYLGNNLLRGSGYLLTGYESGASADVSLVSYDYVAAAFSSPKLIFSVDTYTTDGADLINFGLIKVEFSPGVPV